MGIHCTEIAGLLKNIAIPNVQSWEGKEFGPKDSVSAKGHSPQEELLHSEYLAELQKVLLDLTDKEKQLIQAYYFRGKTHQEIADKWGVTASRISQCHSLLKKKLFHRLKRHPYFSDLQPK